MLSKLTITERLHSQMFTPFELGVKGSDIALSDYKNMASTLIREKSVPAKFVGTLFSRISVGKILRRSRRLMLAQPNT